MHPAEPPKPSGGPRRYGRMSLALVTCNQRRDKTKGHACVPRQTKPRYTSLHKSLTISTWHSTSCQTLPLRATVLGLRHLALVTVLR